MSQNYVNTAGRSRASQIPVHSPVWRNIRKAYLEILHNLPPDYDYDWREIGCAPEYFAEAFRNYEITRHACIILKMQGRLPNWPEWASIPASIEATFISLNQEMRLGREQGLLLDLAAVTLTPEDLSHVY